MNERFLKAHNMLGARDTKMSHINAGPSLTELQVSVMTLFIGSNVYFDLLYLH